MEEFRLVVGVDVDHVAVGREHSKTSNLRCDAAVSEARAMGAGTHRAGNRLLVDVAHVGQRQSVPVEFPVELLQRDTGSDRDEAGRGVDVMQLIQRVNRDVKVGRDGDGRERVSGPHDLDAAPFGIGSCDDRCKFVFAAWSEDLAWLETLKLRPVRDFSPCHHQCLRSTGNSSTTSVPSTSHIVSCRATVGSRWAGTRRIR